MPHTKKELNPLWNLLSEPLAQILAAVGLLLSGVLGLVGKLVSHHVNSFTVPLSRTRTNNLYSSVDLVWVAYLTTFSEVLA